MVGNSNGVQNSLIQDSLTQNSLTQHSLAGAVLPGGVRAVVVTPDVGGAVCEYIAAFAVPALAPERIVRGWENRGGLPPEVKDFAVVSLLAETRQGANVKELIVAPDNAAVGSGPGSDADAAAADGVLFARKLIRCAVQVDFCSEDADAARWRASALEIVTCDEFGANFLKPYGLSALYADNPENITAPDGPEPGAPCWRVVLYLSGWFSLGLPGEWFEKAAMARVENVGVHHPARAG